MRKEKRRETKFKQYTLPWPPRCRWMWPEAESCRELPKWFCLLKKRKKIRHSLFCCCVGYLCLRRSWSYCLTRQVEHIKAHPARCNLHSIPPWQVMMVSSSSGRSRSPVLLWKCSDCGHRFPVSTPSHTVYKKYEDRSQTPYGYSVTMPVSLCTECKQELFSAIFPQELRNFVPIILNEPRQAQGEAGAE